MSKHIQRLVSKHLSNWIGVPPSFTFIGLYSRSAKVQLPSSSIVDEFKAGRVRFHMMLRDSRDHLIREVQPEVKSDRKWTAERAVDETEASLRPCGVRAVELAWAITHIAGFSLKNQMAAVKWSSRRFIPSTKKGGQL